MQQLQDVRFGRLIVLQEVEPTIYFYRKGKVRARNFLCLCDCGTEKVIRMSAIKSGLTKSCGCYNSEKTIERNYKHGFSTRSDKHPLYGVWKTMKHRCYNPNAEFYKYYGGKGITVCPEWRNDAEAFIKWSLQNGWVKGLEIDRINNNSNYEPSNCRYVTHLANMQNCDFNRNKNKE
jgi:hypothetical protein